jgi:CubicO group peptidase (beta-lactamase class C family)
VGTFWWQGAAGTMFFVDPREDLIAICFSQVFGGGQATPGYSFQDQFERLVYESLL